MEGEDSKTDPDDSSLEGFEKRGKDIKKRHEQTSERLRKLNSESSEWLRSIQKTGDSDQDKA